MPLLGIVIGGWYGLYNHNYVSRGCLRSDCIGGYVNFPAATKDEQKKFKVQGSGRGFENLATHKESLFMKS